MVAIKRLHRQQADFEEQMQALLSWESVSDDRVNQIVNDIIAQVRSRGDEALIELTAKLDNYQVSDFSQLEISQSRLQESLNRISPQLLEALQYAAERIRLYHERQVEKTWVYEEEDGTRLGQKITPLDSVGLYVPGGKAAYPSSVLMNAIPAKVAGVKNLIMVVPTPEGEVNEMVLAAAAIAGVDRVFAIGGAQAVAALAYGTQTVPKVDKIVGPGNIFVATAKRAVFGQVGIDMIAGPSEILVVSDGSGKADWTAMDLFSQAEHDEQAQAILVTTDANFADEVAKAIERLLPQQPRETIIRTALEARGAIIVVDSMDEALEMINLIAPEHLELAVKDPEALLPGIRHAGAIFMGHYTAEALGDYCIGPNHVLPTSGTARFSSPLGVYDFQKRSSLIQVSAQGAKIIGAKAAILAEGEGLYAHQQSALFRTED